MSEDANERAARNARGAEHERARGDYYYTGPAVDHSLLSPSGKMSKRARGRAQKRETERLFPPGYLGEGGFRGTPSPEQLRATARDADLQYAKLLRGLAERGMGPRKHRKLADQLETKWCTCDDGTCVVHTHDVEDA